METAQSSPQTKGNAHPSREAEVQGIAEIRGGIKVRKSLQVRGDGVRSPPPLADFADTCGFYRFKPRRELLPRAIQMPPKTVGRLVGCMWGCAPLQEHGHEERQMEDAVPLHDILCVEDVGLPDPSLESLAELVEGGVPLVPPAFHLDGAYLTVPPDEEIDLHLASVGFGVAPRIEEQRPPRRGEALRDGIFRDHAPVEVDIPREDGLVELSGRCALVTQRVRHQEPGVAHVELQGEEVRG